MKKFVMAALGGTVAGVLLTTQVAGPLIAQEAERNESVYQQLDLFGDIFERIRSRSMSKRSRPKPDRGGDQRHAHLA
jgi:carboxyl-terminal processing protease